METKKTSFNDIKGMLTRDQMKQVKGGTKAAAGGSCIGSVGSWYYPNGATWSQCMADIGTYCSSGSGTCS